MNLLQLNTSYTSSSKLRYFKTPYQRKFQNVVISILETYRKLLQHLVSASAGTPWNDATIKPSTALIMLKNLETWCARRLWQPIRSIQTPSMGRCVAVLYQELEPPVINGVRKPKKVGGGRSLIEKKM